MADLYDVLDLVAEERRPTREQLVAYCTQQLNKPMPDDVAEAIVATLRDYGQRIDLRFNVRAGEQRLTQVDVWRPVMPENRNIQWVEIAGKQIDARKLVCEQCQTLDLDVDVDTTGVAWKATCTLGHTWEFFPEESLA